MEKKEKVLYAIDINRVTTYSLIGIILGSILAFVSVSTLTQLIVLLIGICVIIVNGFRVYKDVKENVNTNQTLISALGILAGFLLLMIGNKIVDIIIACYLIIEPVILIALDKFSKKSMADNLPRILVGVVLLLGLTVIGEVAFKTIGIIILVGSIIYLGINYYLYKKSGVKIIEK